MTSLNQGLRRSQKALACEVGPKLVLYLSPDIPVDFELLVLAAIMFKLIKVDVFKVRYFLSLCLKSGIFNADILSRDFCLNARSILL